MSEIHKWLGLHGLRGNRCQNYGETWNTDGDPSEMKWPIHLLNILPLRFLLLHRDQKVGQAADLAHTKTGEGEPTAETSSRQTARQATWSLQWQRNAGRARTEWTHTAIPNGASLARPRNHSSDTHNIRTWVQRSWGPNRMLMLSWCRGVEGGRIPDEL